MVLSVGVESGVVMDFGEVEVVEFESLRRGGGGGGQCWGMRVRTNESHTGN